MVDAMAVGASALAVPDAAVAYVVSGMARLGERRPLLVVTPTVLDAERLSHDIGAFLGDDTVALFPAWDTLPFERVSPELSTMGRRLRLLWRLRDPARAPAVIVAPVRALLQRLGSVEEAAVPIVLSRGGRLDQQDLVSRLVALGYRREYQVEHRGELAVRGGIIDVYPSTAELPVRIDLWGDEVDRLTEFDPGDQRSVADLDDVELFGCREVLPTEAVRARAAVLVGTEPWGRAQWERLAEGQVFDGMESWLPWLVDDERVLPDLVGAGGPGRARRSPPHPGPRRRAQRRGGGAGGSAGRDVGRVARRRGPRGRRAGHGLPPAERPLRTAPGAQRGAGAVDGARGRLALDARDRGARHRTRPRRSGPPGGAPHGAVGGRLLGDAVRRGSGLGGAPGRGAGRGGHDRSRR